MSYADLFLGLLIIALLIVAAVRILAPPPARELQRDDQGRLVAIGERARSAGQISGRGSQTSAPLTLAAGAYRLDYDFAALTRLALIDAGGDETLLIASGAGTQGFEVAQAGRYRLLVEPNDESAAWRIDYRQIG